MELIVVDTGVLIATLDPSDRHHRAATTALAAAAGGGDDLVLPAAAYAELLVDPARSGPAAVSRVDAFLDDLGIRVAPVTRAIAHRAAFLRASHGGRMRLPDALVVATAQELGASGILTRDGRWPSVDVTVEVVAGSDEEDR